MPVTVKGLDEELRRLDRLTEENKRKHIKSLRRWTPIFKYVSIFNLFAAKLALISFFFLEGGLLGLFMGIVNIGCGVWNYFQYKKMYNEYDNEVVNAI